MRMSEFDEVLDGQGDSVLFVFDVDKSSPTNVARLREVQRAVGDDKLGIDKSAPRAQRIQAKAVGVARVRNSMSQALDALSDSFASSIGKTIGQLELDEIEVGLEVSGDGKVGILGVGFGMSGKSSITVRFKRARDAVKS